MASLEKKCDEVWAKLDVTDKDIDNMGELLYEASKSLGYVDSSINFLLALGGKKTLDNKKLKGDLEEVNKAMAALNILFCGLGSLASKDISYKQATARCAELKKEYDKLKSNPAAAMYNPDVNQILTGYITLSYLTEKVKKEATKKSK